MSRDTKQSTLHHHHATDFVVVSTAAMVVTAVVSTAVGYYYYYHHYHQNSTVTNEPTPTTTPTVSKHHNGNQNAEETTVIHGTKSNNNNSIIDDDDNLLQPPMPMIDTTTLGHTSNTQGMSQRSHGENQPSLLLLPPPIPVHARRVVSHHTITIVHGSMTGTCLKFATQMYHEIQRRILQEQQQQDEALSVWNKMHVQMGCIQDFDWWDELINEDDDGDAHDIENVNRASNNNYKTPTTSSSNAMATTTATLIVLLPTYTNGTFTPNSVNLQEALEEIQSDWRIAQHPLQDKLQVAVFGSGSSEYNDTHRSTTTPISSTKMDSMKQTAVTTNNMGQPAKMAVRAFHKLGAKVLTKLMIGDDAVGDHMDVTFQQWNTNVTKELFVANQHQKKFILQQLNQRKKQFSTLPPTTSTTTPSSSATNQNTTCGCHSNTNNSTNNLCDSNVETTPNDSTTSNANASTTCCSTKVKDHQNGCCQTLTATMTNNSTTATTTDEINVHDANHHETYDDEYDDDDDEDDDFGDDDDDDDDDNGNAEPDVMDLEDIGDAINQASLETKTNEPREMVTPSQAIALKKEGYKLIGTHSAVKLCRWTKHQLRGRGGCYKHTFYGITSYQCMEATPSLACANKCVFCWRHHKNPVGKEWRWKTDDPYYIVDEAVQTHIHMIKETRGIPGVQLDRWKEAHTVRHCALSLVGEPIMYPRIDELLGELHRRKISTFLVTNGQHPTAIGSIRPITQLYVSVDAPTEQSLIAIDRPLFQDAWDRLRLSLSSLKDKGQRTVARLTVVKGWNSDEISGYAELIALGQVSLVEVKGVTFCGKSDASNLNMTNTPWHHEVVDLTRTLKDELNRMRQTDPNIPEYDLACEHKHSCSVLLARVDQFATEGYDATTGQRKWRTWIDYDKFHALAARHLEDPSCKFTVVDYTAPTPDWAIFGAKEEGFDPTDRRHRKQTKYPKYTQFDIDGVPTHDDDHQELSMPERQRLRSMMEEKKRQIGDGSTVTELRGGEKEVLDASLMFRGLVVAK